MTKRTFLVVPLSGLIFGIGFLLLNLLRGLSAHDAMIEGVGHFFLGAVLGGSLLIFRVHGRKR